MQKLVIFLCFVTVSLISCNQKLKQELEQKQEELMVLHDEVMPKSMRIDKLKANLQALAKSQVDNDSLSEAIFDTSIKLQKANDDMYIWMKDFGKAMNDVEDLNEKKKLYDELGIEIERIKAETDENTEKAKKILQQ